MEDANFPEIFVSKLSLVFVCGQQCNFQTNNHSPERSFFLITSEINLINRQEDCDIFNAGCCFSPDLVVPLKPLKGPRTHKTS